MAVGLPVTNKVTTISLPEIVHLRQTFSHVGNLLQPMPQVEKKSVRKLMQKVVQQP